MTISRSSEQLSLLKLQAYLVALPGTLLMVLLTLALNMQAAPDPFNRVALPLLATALLVLNLLLHLRLVPLRWIEHGFYLVAAASFLSKFGALVAGAPLAAPDAQMAQVYIWAPFIYLLGSLIFPIQEALKRSLVVYGLSLALAASATWMGAEGLGSLTRLAEFHLASGLWIAMLYVLGTLRTRLSDLKVKLGEMERLAYRDPLTGVGNRRQMELWLAQQADQFQRYGTSWAVILLDLDNFKRINDEHGHDRGDTVLRQAAQLMQAELRGSDGLARWGGEEFLIVVPQTDLFHARALAERLRALISQPSFGEVGTVTASFGVAAYRDGEGIAGLMQRADEALYRAKRGGRNRVEAARILSEPLTLPALRQPFVAPEPGPHPGVCREVADWLQTFELGPQNDHACSAFAASFTGLAAALHPRAPAQALRLTADWYSLMFLHDDRCDSSGIGKDLARLQQLSDRLLSIFQGSALRPDDEPLAHALADLRARLLAHGGARWFQDLTEQVRAYFDALLWEAANRASGTVPELGEYVRRRPVTAGLKIDAAFIEVMDGVRIPPAARQHPAVENLGHLADRAVCWSNDILSLEKELQEGDVHNLVLVLMRGCNLDMEAALNEAARMYHEEIEGLLIGERALPSFGPEADAELWAYVQLLKARVGGILAWSRRSKRYHAAEITT